MLFYIIPLILFSLIFAIFIISIITVRKPEFRKKVATFLSVIAVSLPVPIALLVGFVIGFMINFSACYKQSCSTFETYAMLIVPAIGLLLAIPLTIIAAKRYQMIKVSASVNRRPWVIALALSSIVVLPFGFQLIVLSIQNFIYHY